MRATQAVPTGEPFRDGNTNGEARTWQRVELTYPDGAVLHMDVDIEWPRENESITDFALDRSDLYRNIGWAA